MEVFFEESPVLTRAVQRRTTAAGESFAEQIALLLLDPALHLATGLVDFFVKFGGAAREACHDEPRVVLVAEPLGFADHAVGATLGNPSRVTKLGSDPRGTAGEHGLLAGPDQGRRQFFPQQRVARQADHVIHAVRFAPREDHLPAEPAVAAEHDPRLRAATADRGDDFFQGRDRAVTGSYPLFSCL